MFINKIVNAEFNYKGVIYGRAWPRVRVGVRISNFVDSYTRSWESGIDEDYMKKFLLKQLRDRSDS